MSYIQYDVYGISSNASTMKTVCLLNERNIHFNFVDLNIDSAVRSFIKELGFSLEDIPIIYECAKNGNTYVGNYEDLIKHLEL